VTIGAQFALVMTLVPLTYVLVLFVFLAKGWVIRAGLSTFIIASFPIWWLMTLPSEETSFAGTGIFLMLGLVPLSVSALTAIVGSIILALKHFRQTRAS
jgi:hypothetical protein